MDHRNPPAEVIRQLLTAARTVAVVGASARPERPSHRIFRYLLEAGYRVFPVNPNETEVLGVQSYPTLAAVPEPVDIVDVFRRSEHAPGVAADAVGAGAGALWLQLGIASDRAAAIATSAGLTVVMDSCIAVVHSALEVPRIRRP